MQNVSIQKASELPQGVKSAVEKLLGRAVDADEEVSIVAVPASQIPPSENRATVAQKLEQLLNRREERVKDILDEDLNAVIDRVVDDARHSRR